MATSSGCPLQGGLDAFILLYAWTCLVPPSSLMYTPACIALPPPTCCTVLMLASKQVICKLLQGACLAGDVSEVTALLHHHQGLGRRPTLEMQNTRINMFGKQKMLDAAFAVGEEIRKASGGLPRITALELLRACRGVGCR